jgi:PAS domain S-box-containing protein
MMGSRATDGDAAKASSDPATVRVGGPDAGRIDQRAAAGEPAEDVVRRRLAEAEATLEAIRTGRVDAVVVEGSEGHEGQHVYTLESADLPYQRFLEQMAEGAVSLDAASTILYCNRFFAELVDLPREQVLGSSFEAYVAPEKLLAYRSALRADHPQRFGSALRMADGESLPIQLALTPVGSGAGQRFTVVVTDLSERERLSAAREAVEAESLAKDRFLAVLGHELRGPLNVIMGWSGFLMEQRDKLDERAQRALEAIDRNAKLQRRLIEDMVDVARIRSGKLRLSELVVDLVELLRATGAALSLAAKNKGVKLELHLDGPASIMGDGQRLEQMIQNLVGNAIKFTPRGGTVQLGVQRADSLARIVVRDDGCGIEPVLLEQIFQPFRQGAAGESSQRHGGLGLGLAITKQIVELHGGHVRVHSEGLGRGATFIVELPLYEGGARVERAPPSAELSLLGRRILVVDDEADAREITARTLASAGAEVICVAGAEPALAQLESQPFDVIISDLMMPGTDGWDFARQVRQRFGERPVLLALSGALGSGVAARAAASGYATLLAKPAAPGELLASVRRLLGA